MRLTINPETPPVAILDLEVRGVLCPLCCCAFPKGPCPDCGNPEVVELKHLLSACEATCACGQHPVRFVSVIAEAVAIAHLGACDSVIEA